jgi:hypothetical protein
MRHITLSLFALTIALSSRVSAQCPAPGPAGPGTLVGTISDTARNPIDSMEVFILSAKRQTMTVNGVFRFDKLKPDRYEVTIRRFGYPTVRRFVAVGDSGGSVAFCLAPMPTSLAPVVTAAPRGGLSGVIADTAFGIVPGAQIRVLGIDGSAQSDSLGKFFIPVKPGRYMVRVTRPGFASKMVSVTIPSDSGRKMLIWLLPSNRGIAAREEVAAQELAWRLDTISPSHARIFTREDLNNSPMDDLRQIAQMGAVRPVDDQCIASIDGGMYGMPVWALKSADLEMVEVYTDRGPATASRDRRGNPAKCPRIFAWMRKP